MNYGVHSAADRKMSGAALAPLLGIVVAVPF